MIAEVEVKSSVNAFEFSDDLSDEALDRASVSAAICSGSFCFGV